MFDAIQKAIMTPEQIKARESAEKARQGAEFIGISMTVLALAFLLTATVQRGWLTVVEAVGLFLLANGLWLVIRNRKGA